MHTTRSSLIGFSFLATLSVTVGACAPEQEALVVRHAPGWPDDGTCQILPDSANFMGGGVLDLSFETRYLQPFVLQNRLLPTELSNSGVDDSEMKLVAATVELEIPQAPDIIAELAAKEPTLVSFRVPMASNSFSGGGELGLGVVTLPKNTVDELRDAVLDRFDPDVELTVLTNTVFHAYLGSNPGLTDGNGRFSRNFEVDSRTFSFPIDLCFGCLRHCPSDPTNTSPYVAESRCGTAQDEVVTPAGCVEAEE